MKKNLPFLFSAFILLSCQNKAKQHQDAVNDMLEQHGGDKKEQSPAAAKPPSPEISSSPLMGEWKAVLVTGDTNANGMMDPEEKEKGITTYSDYLKLNADGSCEYTVARIAGHYEIVEKDGNRSIEIPIADGSSVKYGRIISLKPGELQLMKFTGGRDIIVYNRP